jgi:hypothetical protein
MLLGLCAVIWLAFVGMLVGAIVVLAGTGEGSASAGPSLGIYIVIGVSVAVIVGAVPLLLRARKTAAQRTARGASKSKGPNVSRVEKASSGPPPAEAATEKLKAFGGLSDPVNQVSQDYVGPGSPAYRAAAEEAAKSAVADRLWLRATVGIAGAIGLALLAVVTGTYLLAVDSDTAAIVAFAFAGLITCAMGVIPWLTLKKLRELGASGSSDK